MKRFILTLVVFALATVTANDAFAWPRLFRRNAPVYPTPAPAVVVQPQGQGYRAYSYQPGPAVTVGTYWTAPRAATGFGDATRKMTGRY